MQFLLLIILVQAMYSIGDLGRKMVLHGRPFDLSLLASPQLVFTLVLSLLAFVLQLYVMKHIDLSKAIVLLGICAVIFSTVLGAVFLKEKIGLYHYLGLGFAVLAIVFTHLSEAK